MRMEIIDSKMHQPQPIDGWPKDMDQATRDAMAMEIALAEMDASGVDAAVLIASHSFSEMCFTRHQRQFAATPMVKPDDPNVEEFVWNLRAQFSGPTDHSTGARHMARWLGIRLVIMWPPPTDKALEPFRAGAYEPILTAAEKRQVPTRVFLMGELQEALTIVKSHPDLNLIIEHLGFKAPPMMNLDNPPFRQLDLLLQLAEFPNVSVDIAGAPQLSREKYPFLDLWPPLHEIIKAFGPERVIWGADHTRVKGMTTYSESVNYILYSNELSEHDKELIMGANIRRILRWPRFQS